MFNTFTLKLLTAGIALAQFLPGHAHAKEVVAPQTVAVFQDNDGIPCRITAAGAVRTVQCHTRGRWRDMFVNAKGAAQAASAAALDALWAANNVRPTVRFAFAN